ncbi:MAG TPA: NUDIX domain-containing protein [Ktedonobacterales bacterium]|nr:NUDIX domain-containing protein [Ktedonobacterales bacterium]
MEQDRFAAMPSDNPDELFDLVDLDDRVIGTVRRGDAHRNPALVHRSVQVLVFSSDGRLLLQRRSRRKDLFPGYYCASASGHVGAGEYYTGTAERELQEELGIAAPLSLLGKAVVRTEPETEITEIFATSSDGPYTFHPTETDGGILLPLSQVRLGRANRTLAMTPALLAALDVLEIQLALPSSSRPAPLHSL